MKYLFLFTLAIILSLWFYLFIPQSPAVHILKQNTDERGLTCVQFTQDGNTWALDYLTPEQLDSLKTIQ